jgi:hypothetical protein
VPRAAGIPRAPEGPGDGFRHPFRLGQGSGRVIEIDEGATVPQIRTPWG